MLSPRRSAFSLIELLIVIGVVGILLALLFPAVQNVRATATRTECLNNFKQIGLGLHAYHNVQNRLPNNEGCFGWMGIILPYLEGEALFNISEEACQIEKNPLNNPPHKGLTTVIRWYVCPADNRLTSAQLCPLGFPVALTSYTGNAGSVHSGRGFKGVFPDRPRLIDFRDGTSTTFVASERPPPDNFMSGWWYPNVFVGDNHGPHHYLVGVGASSPHWVDENCDAPSRSAVFGPGRTHNICDRYHYWSLHSGGANFLFADGSVRFIPYTIGEKLILSLASRNGGEVVDLP